jgi:DNA-binding response OmpR family regulator
MKILIVEDEAELLASVRSYLASEGFLCETAADYNKASELIATYDYDCIVVDITIPHGSGLDLIRELKKIKPSTGIIIISAKNSIDDKIKGLELGSDDYLTKPFHLSELNARIKALIRRRSFEGTDKFTCNELSIDIAARHVFVDSKEITLTQKEYELLLYFTANRNKVLTRDAIAEHLWGSSIDQADSFDFIYSHIKNLRKKITDAGGSDPIKTVYGLGYKFICS